MTDPRKNASRPSTPRTTGGSNEAKPSPSETPAPTRSNEPSEQQRLPRDTFGTPPLHLVRGGKDATAQEDEAARDLDPRTPRGPDDGDTPSRTSPTRRPPQP